MPCNEMQDIVDEATDLIYEFAVEVNIYDNTFFADSQDRPIPGGLAYIGTSVVTKVGRSKLVDVPTGSGIYDRQAIQCLAPVKDAGLFQDRYVAQETESLLVWEIRKEPYTATVPEGIYTQFSMIRMLIPPVPLNVNANLS